MVKRIKEYYMERGFFEKAILISLIVFSFILVINSSYGLFLSPESLSEGIVGYWNFDDEITDGIANDNSANSNPGICSLGFCPSQVLGYLFNAYSFDGVDDQIDIGNFDVSGSEISIAAWINPKSFESPYNDNRIISKSTSDSEQDHYWMLSTRKVGDETFLRFRIKTDGETETFVAESGDIKLNEWSHVVAIYDGSNVKLYQNNLEVGSFTQSGDIVTNDQVSASIGRNPDGYGAWHGEIDEVIIWNRALSESEISDLYNNGISIIEESVEEVPEVVDEPVIEDPAIEEELPVEEPFIEEPIIEEDPPVEEPFVENSVVENPAIDDPAEEVEVLPSVLDCSLLDAQWSVERIGEGKNVLLEVIGEGCDGLEIDFIIREDDFAGDDNVNVNPSPTIFNDGVAKTIWKAEWQYDGLFGENPEFYFVAILADGQSSELIQNSIIPINLQFLPGGGGGSIQSPLLEVTAGEEGGSGAVCGDGNVEKGEMCDDGNLISGDGCDISCQVEIGYVCDWTHYDSPDSLNPESACSVHDVQTTNIISQYGITWTFDTNYEYGQFANGDYWVVGPVTVTSITPDYTGTRHGWQIDPLPASFYQEYADTGYDNNGHAYDVNKGQSFDNRIEAFRTYLLPSDLSSSYTISPTMNGQDKVTAIKTISAGASGASCPVGDGHNCISAVSALTVVSNAPPNYGVTAFRPGYAIGDKGYSYVTDLDLDLIPSLPAPSGSYSDMPDISSIESDYSRVHLDHYPSNGKVRYLHPVYIPNYGADYARDNTQIPLRLMLDDLTIDQKLPSIIGYTQVGIDLYSNMEAGQIWPALSGHGLSRKMPIVFAATLLGDSNMQSDIINAADQTIGENTGDFAFNTFHEDGMFVDQSPQGIKLYGNRNTNNYWRRILFSSGTRQAKDPYQFIDAGNYGESTYQYCCNSLIPRDTSLVMHLMPELKSVWNHDGYLEYADRWVGNGIWSQPDPCAPAPSSVPSGITSVEDVPGYGVTWGPDNSNDAGCVLDQDLAYYNSRDDFACQPGQQCGRFPTYHGSNANQGDRSTAFAGAMWDEYRPLYGDTGYLCYNGVQDGAETGVDCGGDCPKACDFCVVDTDCNDGNSCTSETCDGVGAPGADGAGCVYNPLIGNSCDDSQYCTTGDSCNALGVCEGTIDVGLACDDGASCTTGDSCNALGVCEGTFDTVLCPFDPALVAYWSFDETSGTIASDNGPNGYDGVVNGASFVTGQENNALSFDGSNDYVDITSGIDLSGSEMTIAAWITSDSLSGDRRIISRATGTSEQDHYWMLSERSNELRLRLKTSGGTTTHVAPITIPTSGWKHVAVTYNSGTATFYEDGSLVESVAYGSGNIIDDSLVPAYIGANPNGGSTAEEWDGMIDEVAIWNRALSNAEVSDVYNNGVIGAPTPSACNNDGIKDSGEECDGSDFGIESCVTQGFDSGSLSCTSSCTIVTSACTYDSVGECSDANILCVDDDAGATQEYSTIQSAIDASSAGDTVLVYPGNYISEGVINLNVPGVDDSTRVTVTSQTSRAAYVYGFEISADYVTVEGFDITTSQDNVNGIYAGSVNGAEVIDNYLHEIARYALQISGNDNVVRDNHFYMNQINIDISGDSYLVENNEIERVYNWADFLQISGYLGDADNVRFHGTNGVFRGNYMHGTSYAELTDGDNGNLYDSAHADGFQTFSPNAGVGMVFENNLMLDMHQGFMFSGPGGNYIIRNNIVKGMLDESGGNRNALYGIHAKNDITNVEIYNNVFTHYRYHAIEFKEGAAGTIRNNIFYDTSQSDLNTMSDAYYAQSTGTINDASNNLLYTHNGAVTVSSPYTGDVVEDPLFVDVANLDYNLQSGSPAIDSGFDLSGVVDSDRDGVARPQGSGWDMGAYEYLESGVASVSSSFSSSGSSSGGGSGSSTNVEQDNTVTFEAEVTCTGGDCGDVIVTLDPEVVTRSNDATELFTVPENKKENFFFIILGVLVFGIVMVFISRKIYYINLVKKINIKFLNNNN